jgi:hypothetical protein
MSYLLYYPMFHVSYLEHFNRIGTLLDEVRSDLGENESEDLKGAVEGLRNNLTFDALEGFWNDFSNYLKTQEPFNHLYLETTGQIIQPDIKQGSAMQNCIDYIVESGAKLEQTESDFWNHMASYTGRIKGLRKFTNRKREKSVVSNITRTLKGDDRGILLFGGGHMKRLVSRLLNTELELEVYERKIEEILESPDTLL